MTGWSVTPFRRRTLLVVAFGLPRRGDAGTASHLPQVSLGEVRPLLAFRPSGDLVRCEPGDGRSGVAGGCG